MDLVDGCKPHANPHTKTLLQRAHSLYHRAYPLSLTSSTGETRTTSRRASLPRFPLTDPQATMAFADFLTTGSGIKRTSSTTSRRSVKVMKNLLPLKLGSPRPPDDRSATPPPIQRSPCSTQPRNQRSTTPPPIPLSTPYSPPSQVESNAIPLQAQQSLFAPGQRSATPPPIRWSRYSSSPDNQSMSPPSFQRSTFGLFESSPDKDSSIFQRRAMKSSRDFTRSSIKIRPEKYRDIPFYNEVGSPKQPDQAYYSYEDICLSCSPTGSSCDETCIIHDYESSKEEDSSSEDESDGEYWYNGLAMQLRDSFPTTFEDSRSHRATSSDLSFKCRGESIASMASEPLFPDEASWLSSPLIRPADSTPITSPTKRPSSERDMEAWFSDSSSCCDEDDDVLGFATALAPAKAQVIEVTSVHRMSVATVTVPPRVSSLKYPPTPDSGRKSRMMLRDRAASRTMKDDDASKQCHFAPFPGARLDLARASPPESPIVDSQQPMEAHRITSFRTFTQAPTAVSVPTPVDSLAALTKSLEEITWTFPSAMLLPDNPCLSIIRAHLHPSRKIVSPPTSPRYLNGVDWRPEPPERSPLRPMASLSTLSTFQTTPHLEPLPSPFNIFGAKTPPSPHFSITPANDTLHTIFPSSSSYLRAALYAHILTYTFLSSIPLRSSPTSPPISSILNKSGVTIPTTTTYALPSKVVSVLGVPALAAKPTRVDISLGNVVLSPTGVELDRIEALAERVKGCIHWLVREMEGGSTCGAVNDGLLGGAEAMDGLVLRSLIEVVRGCEERTAFL